MSVAVFLLLVALVLFGCAAFNVPSSRVNLVAMGLALVTLAQLLGAGIFGRLT